MGVAGEDEVWKKCIISRKSLRFRTRLVSWRRAPPNIVKHFSSIEAYLLTPSIRLPYMLAGSNMQGTFNCGGWGSTPHVHGSAHFPSTTVTDGQALCILYRRQACAML